MKSTSSRGRRQFSVENPYAVSHADAERVGGAHDLGQALLALAVPVGAGEALALGPATVAVHDHGDVHGQARPCSIMRRSPASSTRPAASSRWSVTPAK